MNPIDVHYHGWVVALSFIIAAAASCWALHLVGKSIRSEGMIRTVWLWAGSCVMGSGIWAAHFAGMLALRTEMAVRYDPFVTLLSAMAGIGASFAAFFVTTRQKAGAIEWGLGGVLMGSGVVFMHYTAMAALRAEARFTYDRPLVILSAATALAASFVGIYLFRLLRDKPDCFSRKLLSSIVMGLAVCGMHYTGMEAVRFHREPLPSGVAGSGTEWFLLAGIALATLFIIAISWGAIFVDRHVLERMAYCDPLTGLPNRHGLARFFEGKFARVREGAVFFIDLDRFKAINDTLGHDVGDLLLLEVAGRIRKAADPGIRVFRLGGDEFLIALPDIGVSSVYAWAERFLQELKRPYRIEGNELYVTASIGIALIPGHGTDRPVLMKAADTAMYHAKASGKNKWYVYDDSMGNSQLRRMGLEKDLRKALAHREFIIHYQPKWDSSRNCMVGMEALLRWKHPELGLVSPGEFVPIAEETGLIVPITHWMLRAVCEQNRKWLDSGIAETAVSVNMSARVFESRQLCGMVDEALQGSGLSPCLLELEITESIAMQDTEETVAQLRRLRALGVKVSLDDFGTGHSSLGTLDEMPVDTLKIDQIFIRNSGMPSKRAIISMIMDIARNLQMDVVAEGVETPEQVAFLQSVGCKLMQGYYFAKPMPAEEIGRWLHPDVSE